MSSSSSTAPPIAAETGRWKRVYTAGVIPGPRHVCAHTIYNDKLYIFAGYGWKGCYLNDLYEFDFTTRVWEQLTFPKNQQPPERHSMSHAVYNDKWYMFGGIGPNGQRSNELFAFDFKTKQWAVIGAPQGQVPGPRWGHTAVIWQNAMYVFGGYSDSFHNDLFKYDFATNTWNKEVTAGITPKARHFHTAVVYKDHMYILGGFAGSRNTADFLRYNFGSRTWTVQLGSDSLTQRRGHTAIVWRDNLMVFAGRDSTSLNDLVEVNLITTKAKVIDPEGEVPPPRHFHTCVVHDGKMWVFGGLCHINLNDVYAFQLEDEHEEEIHVGVNFKPLLMNSTFSDVTFVVEGKEIPAHKNILYVSSDHFKAMFSSGMAESTKSSVELVDVKYDVFVALLEFIYTGKAPITSENAVELLITSDKYFIPGLVSKCEDALVRAITSSNVKGLLELAHAHSRTKLKTRCFEFIQKFQSTLYQEIKKDVVKQLAQEMDQFLNIKSSKTKKQKEPEPEIDEFEASTSSST